MIEIDHDGTQFNAPEHVLVNGIKPEISRTARILPNGLDNGHANGLIPSLGVRCSTHRMMPLTEWCCSLKHTSLQPHRSLPSPTTSILWQPFFLMLFFYSTTPVRPSVASMRANSRCGVQISLIRAKERTRTVTRAPALGPLDRPAIEGIYAHLIILKVHGESDHLQLVL